MLFYIYDFFPWLFFIVCLSAFKQPLLVIGINLTVFWDDENNQILSDHLLIGHLWVPILLACIVVCACTPLGQHCSKYLDHFRNADSLPHPPFSPVSGDRSRKLKKVLRMNLHTVKLGKLPPWETYLELDLWATAVCAWSLLLLQIENVIFHGGCIKFYLALRVLGPLQPVMETNFKLGIL